MKTYKQLDDKETKQFWGRIWEGREHNRKVKWINNMEKELQGLEEAPKAKIRLNLLRATLKKVPNLKTPGHDGIHGYWFKKFTTIHDRLAIEMNRCLEETYISEWMTKGKTTLIPKDP